MVKAHIYLPGGKHWDFDYNGIFEPGFKVGDAYLKEDADQVMDAMEKQIRTLENDKEEMYEANLVL